MSTVPVAFRGYGGSLARVSTGKLCLIDYDFRCYLGNHNHGPLIAKGRAMILGITPTKVSGTTRVKPSGSAGKTPGTFKNLKLSKCLSV